MGCRAAQVGLLIFTYFLSIDIVGVLVAGVEIGVAVDETVLAVEATAVGLSVVEDEVPFTQGCCSGNLLQLK